MTTTRTPRSGRPDRSRPRSHPSPQGVGHLHGDRGVCRRAARFLPAGRARTPSSRISRSTRLREVRMPRRRRRAQTLRWPSPLKGESSIVWWISVRSSASAIAPTGPRLRCGRRSASPSRSRRRSSKAAERETPAILQTAPSRCPVSALTSTASLTVDPFFLKKPRFCPIPSFPEAERLCLSTEANASEMASVSLASTASGPFTQYFPIVERRQDLHLSPIEEIERLRDARPSETGSVADVVEGALDGSVERQEGERGAMVLRLGRRLRRSEASPRPGHPLTKGSRRRGRRDSATAKYSCKTEPDEDSTSRTAEG